MADDDIRLYAASALSLDESYELANAYPTRVILVMGERDAGKTTLLAEIHHAYLKAPFAGYMFAGSKTLIGLEERCFLSRLKSGKGNEDTERSKHPEIRVLHIALAPETRPESHVHLLLTDVMGERFKEIRASKDEALELAPLIRRADHIVLLVDGDRLSVAKTQMATEANACVLLRCLLEAGGLDSTRSLEVVISKWDFVVARHAEDRADQLENSVRTVAGALTPRFHRVAARNTNQVDVTPGFGMSELIQSWMNRPAHSALSRHVDLTAANSARWYQRYRFPQGAP